MNKLTKNDVASDDVASDAVAKNAVTDDAVANDGMANDGMARPLWTGEAIAAATGGTLSEPFVVQGVAFDSREVGPGDLFIAMRGDAADGHAFVERAFAGGAAGAIVEHPVAGPHVLVADSFAALNALGQAARARTAAIIIGVTGSAGKTGTKEALAAALDRHAPGSVHRSVKSYNNHSGVPLSLARMPAETRYAVLEMGMNHAGELTQLTQLVRPNIAIVTTIAPAHQAFFASIDAIADAKGEIFAGLEPGGTAIIPFDSPWHARLSAAAAPHAAHIVSFGTQARQQAGQLAGQGAGQPAGQQAGQLAGQPGTADVRAIDWVRDAATGGSLVTAQVGDATLCFALAAPGDHWVANAMAVLAAVDAAGADLAAAGLALGELPGLAGRGARHTITVGSGSALLIDESYNANPASMAATISQLAGQPATRRIVVLGDMRELGEASAGHHRALAGALSGAGVTRAVLVGAEMSALAGALSAANTAQDRLEPPIDFAHVADAAAAQSALLADLKPGDAILIKGSNAVGLSHIVTALIDGVASGLACDLTGDLAGDLAGGET